MGSATKTGTSHVGVGLGVGLGVPLGLLLIGLIALLLHEEEEEPVGASGDAGGCSVHAGHNDDRDRCGEDRASGLGSEVRATDRRQHSKTNRDVDSRGEWHAGDDGQCTGRGSGHFGVVGL